MAPRRWSDGPEPGVVPLNFATSCWLAKPRVSTSVSVTNASGCTAVASSHDVRLTLSSRLSTAGQAAVICSNATGPDGGAVSAVGAAGGVDVASPDAAGSASAFSTTAFSTTAVSATVVSATASDPTSADPTSADSATRWVPAAGAPAAAGWTAAARGAAAG